MRFFNLSMFYPLVMWLSLMLTSHVIQAEEDIVFTLGLPAGHELFKAGEELLTAISLKMGVTIKLISIPSKRSATLLKNNEIHAELARVSEYEKKVPFAIKVPEPIIEFSQYAYSLRPDISIDGWGSLKAYRAVALRGIWIIEVYMADHQVTWVDSLSSAFKFLKLGRADVCIVNSMRADKFLAATDLDVSGIRRLEPAIYSAKDYTFFAAAYPQLALRYGIALRAIKADGSYQAILSKYNM
jgi:polar amino acid transport system substrate-binding protein